MRLRAPSRPRSPLPRAQAARAATAAAVRRSLASQTLELSAYLESKISGAGAEDSATQYTETGAVISVGDGGQPPPRPPERHTIPDPRRVRPRLARCPAHTRPWYVSFFSSGSFSPSSYSCSSSSPSSW